MAVTDLAIEPALRSWIRSRALPEMSLIMPGLSGISSHPLPPPGIFGFLAVGVSVIRSRMIGLSSDGTNHYTAIPILHTSSSRRVILHVRQWKIRENHWQAMKETVFPFSDPGQVNTIEIPENTPDRAKLLIYHRQATLSLARLFTGERLVPCTEARTAFTSLTFLKFLFNSSSQPSVPEGSQP